MQYTMSQTWIPLQLHQKFRATILYSWKNTHVQYMLLAIIPIQSWVQLHSILLEFEGYDCRNILPLWSLSARTQKS